MGKEYGGQGEKGGCSETHCCMAVSSMGLGSQTERSEDEQGDKEKGWDRVWEGKADPVMSGVETFLSGYDS